MKARLLLTAILIFSACAFVSAQTLTPNSSNVLFVKPVASGTGTGDSWDNATDKLRDAILTTGVQQVWVAAGTYKPTTTTDRTISFVMANNVAIYGGFAGTETSLSQRDWVTSKTILSGDLNGDDGANFAGNDENSYNVVSNNRNGLDATAILDGFTITGGNANGSEDPQLIGGGIYNENASPTLTNLIISRNKAALAGGGVFNRSSTASLTNVTISANSAENAGGIVNYTSSSFLTNVTIIGNIATATNSFGGGMINDEYSSPTLTNVTISGNTANSDAGGMGNSMTCSPKLYNTIILGNSSGIYNEPGAALDVLS